MIKNDDVMRIYHILDHAKEALIMIQGKTRDDLDADRLLNLSLVRLLEIIGDTANRVSSETRSRYSEIPWPQIEGLRDRLIQIRRVDFDVLWQIITRDLPPFVNSLEQIVSGQED